MKDLPPYRAYRLTSSHDFLRVSYCHQRFIVGYWRKASIRLLTWLWCPPMSHLSIRTGYPSSPLPHPPPSLPFPSPISLPPHPPPLRSRPFKSSLRLGALKASPEGSGARPVASGGGGRGVESPPPKVWASRHQRLYCYKFGRNVIIYN